MVIMDEEKFIYVFTEEAKNKMIQCGFKLINSDSKYGRYIFENNPKLLKFSKPDVSMIKSNSLTL